MTGIVRKKSSKNSLFSFLFNYQNIECLWKTSQESKYLNPNISIPHKTTNQDFHIIPAFILRFQEHVLPYPYNEGHMEDVFHSACERVWINHKIKEENRCKSWRYKNGLVKRTGGVHRANICEHKLNINNRFKSYVNVYDNFTTMLNSQLHTCRKSSQRIFHSIVCGACTCVYAPISKYVTI